MPSPEVEAALLAQQTDKRIKDLERLVESLITDREKAMRWGILTLGASVLAMASYIFNIITGHVK